VTLEACEAPQIGAVDRVDELNQFVPGQAAPKYLEAYIGKSYRF